MLMSKLNQCGQQRGRIARRGIDDVMREKIRRPAKLIKTTKPFGICSKRALMGGAADALMQHLEWRIEKDHRRRIPFKELPICLLQKGAAAQREHCRAHPWGEDAVQFVVLDGAEAAFAASGEELGNRAVDARNLLIEIDERAAQFSREHARQSGLACAHEADQYEQRTLRLSCVREPGVGLLWSVGH